MGYRLVDINEYDDELVADVKQINTIISRQEIARLIFKMDLPVDSSGNIPYGVILHSAMKNAYGKKFFIDVEKSAYKIIRKSEINCLAEIVARNKREKHLRTLKGLRGEDNHMANPFLLLLFVQMTVRSWMKVGHLYSDNKIQAQAEGKYFLRDHFWYDTDSDQDLDEFEITDRYDIENIEEALDDEGNPIGLIDFGQQNESEQKILKHVPDVQKSNTKEFVKRKPNQFDVIEPPVFGDREMFTIHESDSFIVNVNKQLSSVTDQNLMKKAQKSKICQDSLSMDTAKNVVVSTNPKKHNKELELSDERKKTDEQVAEKQIVVEEDDEEEAMSTLREGDTRLNNVIPFDTVEGFRPAKDSNVKAMHETNDEGFYIDLGKDKADN